MRCWCPGRGGLGVGAALVRGGWARAEARRRAGGAAGLGMAGAPSVAADDGRERASLGERQPPPEQRTVCERI